MITELNADNFEEKTKQGNAIIDFHADWCGPCKIMEPVFEKLSNEFKNINFFKVNVDNNQKIAAIYAVRSIPTIVFLKDDKEIGRVIGLVYEDEFKNKIKEAFK
nr:thioredoxin [Nanoarchaeota archaeon]